jgi:hypothetical protein
VTVPADIRPTFRNVFRGISPIGDCGPATFFDRGRLVRPADDSLPTRKNRRSSAHLALVITLDDLAKVAGRSTGSCFVWSKGDDGRVVVSAETVAPAPQGPDDPVREFVASLGDGVVPALESFGFHPRETTPWLLDWIRGFPVPSDPSGIGDRSGPPGSPDRLLAARRRQAAVAWPWLPYVLESSLRLGGSSFPARSATMISQAIDAAGPLTRVLSATLELPHWAVRRLQGLHPSSMLPPEAGQVPGPDVDIAEEILFFGACPPSCAPSSSHDWIMMMTWRRAVMVPVSHSILSNTRNMASTPGLARRIEADPNLPVREARDRRLSMRGCVREAARLRWLLPGPSEVAALGLNDVLLDAARNLAGPIARSALGQTGFVPPRPVPGDNRERSPEEQFEEACSDLSRFAVSRWLFDDIRPHRMLSLSRNWHARQAGVRHRLKTLFPYPGGPPRLSWLPLLGPDPLLSPDGWTVQELLDAGSVEEEGAVMGHCVGSMAQQCSGGSLHVFALSHASGARATVALDRSPLHQGLPPGVVDHAGPGNAAPPDDSVRAVDWLKDLCLASKPDLEKLDEASRLARSLMRGPHDPDGDPSHPGYLERAFAEWSPILPRDVRKAGVEGLASIVRDAVFWSP